MTKTFFEAAQAPQKSNRKLFDYNLHSKEVGVSMTTECSENAKNDEISTIFLEKRSLQNSVSDSTNEIIEILDKNTNEKNLKESLSENIENYDEEDFKMQKPEISYIRPQLINNKESREDVIPTPQAHNIPKINFSATPSISTKIAKISVQKVVSDAIRDSYSDSKSFINLLKDFKEGWLEKRGGGVLSYKWKSRYCRISNGIFMCYKNVNSNWLSIYIDFRRVPAKIFVDNKNLEIMYFSLYKSIKRIQIWTGKSYKDFVFKAKNPDDLQEWSQSIFLNFSKFQQIASATLNSSLFSLEKFWKHRTIQHSVLLEKADTADLLLFSGTRFACKIQRFLTRSRFGIFQ